MTFLLCRKSEAQWCLIRPACWSVCTPSMPQAPTSVKPSGPAPSSSLSGWIGTRVPWLAWRAQQFLEPSWSDFPSRGPRPTASQGRAPPGQRSCASDACSACPRWPGPGREVEGWSRGLAERGGRQGGRGPVSRPASRQRGRPCSGPHCSRPGVQCFRHGARVVKRDCTSSGAGHSIPLSSQKLTSKKVGGRPRCPHFMGLLWRAGFLSSCVP